jgi:GDP/UDP-N,N'-diacetylbacillosamine 2-epimerase (hydrolysing)
MKKSNKLILIITGSRGDYDILKPIIKKTKESKKLKIKTIVTGSHLISTYGNLKIFDNDKIKIDQKIKIKYFGDKSNSILKFISNGIMRFNSCFVKYKPDLVLILGDRYEIFSAAISAYYNRIPIGHISGGEVTQGSYDDAIRHSITKLSTLHFVANKDYAKRVKQLGEASKNVYDIGNTNLDDIKKIKFDKKNIIEKRINFKFKKTNYLITFHPATLENDFGLSDFELLLKFFSTKPEIGIIFTLPNSDTNNFKIIKLIKQFVKENKNSKYYKFLGKQTYFSIVKLVNAVIGNSSSGISEIPSLKKPTINIGLRQEGRIKAKSIIDLKKLNISSLKNSLIKIKSKRFQSIIRNVKNPYYKKNSLKRIVRVLEEVELKNINLKKFVDINKGKNENKSF